MDSKLKKYIIACAGAGKTTLLINETIKRSENETVLITTFTDANERSIKNKLIKKLGFIPQNIKIKTFDTGLLQRLLNAKKPLFCLNRNLYKVKIGDRIEKIEICKI